MNSTTTAATDRNAAELDRRYIELAVPHLRGIIGFAEAVRPRLAEPRLDQTAQEMIDTETAEMAGLRGYRESIDGDPDPTPMDEGVMNAMDQTTPGMSGSTREMRFQTDPEAQAAAIRGANNADLSSIDLTVAHQRTAVKTSQPVAEQASHAEIREFAQRAVASQQRETAEFLAIRQSVDGSGAPAGSSA